MKPSAFEYVRATSVADAIDALARHEFEAKILAGGQSLVPLMNFRLAAPTVLVDTNGVDGLSYIKRTNGTLAFGAMTRQGAIEDSPIVAESCPLLLEATKLVGHRTVRNRGTIGGSIAHADPSAEYPAVLLALDGDVVVEGASGQRVIPASELFLTVCTTTIAPNELLTEVRLPVLPAGTGSAFLELNRRHGDWAIVGAVAVVTVDARGICEEARIALAGVDATPVRCHAAESVLQGEHLTEQVLAEAARQCAGAVHPGDDLHATGDYKRAMVRVFVERALRLARDRCGRIENV